MIFWYGFWYLAMAGCGALAVLALAMWGIEKAGSARNR